MSVTFFAVLLILISTNASASALADAVTQSTGSILSDHYLVITALVVLSILLLSFDKILYLISEQSKVDKAYKAAFPKDSRPHIVKLTKQEKEKRALEYKKERLASIGQTTFSDKQKKQQRQKIQRKNRNFRKLSKDKKFKRLDDFKAKKSSYEDKQIPSASISSDTHSKKVNEFLASRQSNPNVKSLFDQESKRIQDRINWEEEFDRRNAASKGFKYSKDIPRHLMTEEEIKSDDLKRQNNRDIYMKNLNKDSSFIQSKIDAQTPQKRYDISMNLSHGADESKSSRSYMGGSF